VGRWIFKKWLVATHAIVAAYFSQQKLASLETIDSIPMVGNTVVPEGWFGSARTAPKMRRDSRGYGSTSHLADRNLYPSPPNFADGPSLISDFSPNRDVLQMLQQSSPPLPSARSPSSSPNAQTTALTPRVNSPQQLVPLEILQSVSPPQRDPMDEQLLRRFSGS